MSDLDNTKVVRHSRHEMERHTAESTEEIYAGQGVVESAGRNELSAGVGEGSRFCVAKDHREVGMEVGDAYGVGVNTHYLAVSGGGLRLLLADGETVDPDTEDRLVMNDDGFLEVYDDETHDTYHAVYDHDEVVEASGDFEPIPVVV